MHLYLIRTNQNFIYQHDKRANPYNKGVIHNFKEIIYLFIYFFPAWRNFLSFTTSHWIVKIYKDKRPNFYQVD